MDVELPGISEEVAFARIRDKAEFEIAAGPFLVAGFLLLSENALVVSYSEIQRSVDEMSRRSKHGFTCQRTRFEGANIVL